MNRPPAPDLHSAEYELAERAAVIWADGGHEALQGLKGEERYQAALRIARRQIEEAKRRGEQVNLW